MEGVWGCGSKIGHFIDGFVRGLESSLLMNKQTKFYLFKNKKKRLWNSIMYLCIVYMYLVKYLFIFYAQVKIKTTHFNAVITVVFQ